MKDSESDWQKLQNLLILLLVLVFCLYLPSCFHEAFADDDIYLAFSNRMLREAHWSDLYQLLLRPANPWEYLPLRDFTYWLDFRLYGDEPNGFHATNLVWYAASGLVSFWFFRELILLCRPTWASRATILSLCGTLVFVVHPAHVEVAAWIASRKDLIAGTLGFSSLAVLARATRRHWDRREMILAALLLAAACFGKAAAMTNIVFATVLIGVNWAGSPEISRTKKITYLILFWALFALVFLIHFKVGQASGIRIENSPGMFSMVDRASRILTSLIGILLFPYPLRFYYDVYQIGNWHWLVSFFAAFLILISLRSLSQRPSLWALGVVLSLSSLSIYLQLMPFTTWSLASERFVFVPVAGLALVLIDLVGRIASPAKIGGVVLMLVLPCTTVVWARIADWGDEPKLLVREYKLQPHFHNAIRDRIAFTLLPEKRYLEAETLARQLPRPYAREALLALVGAEQAYRQMTTASSSPSPDRDEELRKNFCRNAEILRSATKNGYAHIPDEPDVSYNNILRTLDHQLKFAYSEARIKCNPAE